MASKQFIEQQWKDSLSSKRWDFTLWQASENGARSVLEYLQSKLPHIDIVSWQKRLSFGGVYFNGRRILSDLELKYPAKIEYYEPKFDIDRAEAFFPKIDESNLIYRKDGIIAFNKPAGLPSLPSKDQLAFNLRCQVMNLLGSKTSLHMPSRLDTSVCGLIVMSEDSKLHGPLQRLFEKRLIKKRYLAVVSKAPDWRKTEINLPIARDLNWGVLRRIDPTYGKVACTRVLNLGLIKGLNSELESYLLAVYPLTGRTHQIRLHLSAIGYPIVGDRFYAGIPAENLHLLSDSVKFVHPITGQHIKIKLPKKTMPNWLSTLYSKNIL